MIKLTANTYYWIFTIGIIFILVIAPLIQDGIFMDGMLYISVGKNLSEGIGTFWNQSFSKTCMFEYHEQPPLYGGLIAIYYKIFGYSMYTERLFCFSFFTLTLAVIAKFWKQLIVNKIRTQIAFLPILFFTITPVVFWAYQNHVEETVMTLFDLLALLYIHKSRFKNEKIYINLFLAALCIVLATLTKGIQGLFPIISIGLIWFANPDKKLLKMSIIKNLYLLLFFIMIYSVLLLLAKDSYSSFQKYFSIRIVNTFNHVGATTENRFYLLFRLLNELIPVVALSSIIYFIGRNKSRITFEKEKNNQEMIWFILVGLSGSLPLMVTLEQRGFYLVTSLPYFILALAIAVSDNFKSIQINTKLIIYTGRVFSVSVLIAGLSYSFYSVGKSKRDKELLHDIYLCQNIFKKGEIIGIPESMWNDWNLQTYMVRYNYVSLSMAKDNLHYIIRKDLEKSLVPENYKLLKLKTDFFDIYELESSKN